MLVVVLTALTAALAVLCRCCLLGFEIEPEGDGIFRVVLVLVNSSC